MLRRIDPSDSIQNHLEPFYFEVKYKRDTRISDIYAGNLDAGRMAVQNQLDLEIDRNLIAFQSVMTRYLDNHRGDFAVIRDQGVVGICRTFKEAISQAHSRFDDGLFSIQEITDQPVDLGFFSHASSNG
jgi:hypothetical protein